MLHPEEAWPRRWVQRRWAFAGLALAIALAVGAIVVAVVLAAGGDEKARSAAAPAPPTVQPPQSFDAEAAGVTVRLSWSAPTGGVAVDHYDIYRNGSLLVTLSDAGSTYIDDAIRVGKEYTYEIQARGKARGKEMTSERISALVTTPVPSLKSARVAGDFTVKAKTLSRSGYTKYETPTYGWLLKPKCEAGACNVTWADLHEKGIRAVLKRKGARYSGSYSGFFFVFCGKTRATSSVKIELKVARAKVIEGEWRATKLVGTISEYQSPQLGCVASQARQALTAKLVT